MQKSKNGISLIALIITIIILLILAGISVTAVLGDNGIFKMSKKASDKTKYSSVVEDLELAWTARLSEYLENHSKNQKATKSNFFTLDSLNDELTSGTVSNYKYKENGETSFTYTDNSTGTQYGVLVSSTGKATVISCNEKTIEDSYLVDVVQVGDYVDIGLDYKNCSNFFGEYTIGGEELYGEKGPTGWRVLSKTGSGKNGYVTLVSAGTPFIFKYKSSDTTIYAATTDDMTDSASSIYVLNYMYPYLWGTSDGSQYSYTGFENTTKDLTQIFDTNKYVDTTKGIHALKAGTDILGYNLWNNTLEVENLYKIITDEKNVRSIIDFDYIYGDVGYIKNVFNSSELGLTLEDKTVDLLCNGMVYYLGGSNYMDYFNIYNRDDLTIEEGSEEGKYIVTGDNLVISSGLFGVFPNGMLVGMASGQFGVRPVVTLKSGVQVSDDNTGNGYYGSPYTLK
jgi:hypothetical protein